MMTLLKELKSEANAIGMRNNEVIKTKFENLLQMKKN